MPVARRRAAVRAVGDGRLRGDCRRHRGASRPIDRCGCGSLDRIYTGAADRDAIAPGTCAEIATGAPLPEGADAVVMVEETAPRRRRPRRHHSPRPPRARTSAGAAPTSRPAIVVVRRGELLKPSRVGALAAIGCVELEVYARPRVAMLSTGNEVVDPGTAARARTDLRRQPLHAGRRRRRPRRHARAASARPGHARRAPGRARRRARAQT